MSDDSQSTPSNVELGQFAHRMNNAVAYVLTNLNLLAEELEGPVGLEPKQRARVLQRIEDATQGTAKMASVVRELQTAAWGPSDALNSDALSEDTWDEGGTARILIIDDEEPILASLRLALRRYEITALNQPRVALDRLEKGEKFDLILCDLIMPDVSGIEVYRWLQRNRKDLLPQIMFMTAGAFTPELRAFLSGVNNPVLHKPFDTKTLRWMVAQQLRVTE